MKTRTKTLILLATTGLLLTAANLANKSYKLDLETTKVIWKGEKAIGGGHDGTIDLKSGSLIMNGDELAGGEFVIDMNSMKCTDLTDPENAAKLIGHLKSDDFFGVEKHPTASFKITSVSKQEKGSYSVKGDLSIKGKTEAITFPAKIKKEGSKYVAESTIIFDRSKFDVKYGSGSFFDELGDKTISDDITIIVNMLTK